MEGNQLKIQSMNRLQGAWSPWIGMIALFALLVVTTGQPLGAQTGGRQVFGMVLHSSDPMTLSQGGFAPVWGTQSPLRSLSNPALLETGLGRSYAAAWVQRSAGLGQGEVAWVVPTPQESRWTMAWGARFSGTGSMARTNPFGQMEGEHRASEGALIYSLAHRFSPRWNWGVQGRLYSSQLGGYAAWGGGLGLALRYEDPEQRRAYALLMDDLTLVFRDYLPGSLGQRLVPRRVSLITTQALAHLPLRWTLGLQHLENWSLRYQDPNDPFQNRVFSLNDSDTLRESALSAVRQELFLHLVLGAEINLGKYLRFRTGYQALSRAEWSFPERTGGSGFRWGLALETKRIRMEFTTFPQTLAGRTSAFSLTFVPH